MTQTQPQFFQVLSRTNDINGNPYRLVLVYGADSAIVEAYEARSSSPNICGVLRGRGLLELPSFHLAAAEYNATRKAFKAKAEY